MYKCKDCKETFESMSIIGDWYGISEVCPCCNSVYIEELEECKKCGEYFIKHELDGGVCDECCEEEVA